MLNAAKCLMLITVCALAMACTNSPKGESALTGHSPVDSLELITTGTQLVPGFRQLDSMSVLFYKDPFGADAEQYTRFYKIFSSNSDSLMGLVQQNMELPFAEDSLRNCRSEGKMYCFSKGKVVQTLYFNTVQEKCTQLYFIHEARYYYFKPTQSVIRHLARLKPKAKA